MSKSHSFSIYLLKEGRDSASSLREGHGFKPVDAENLPEGGVLLARDSKKYPPWWKSYFGVSKDLYQAANSAWLFLPVEGRCFALSFGYAFHSLDEEAYEYDFGLLVTLNSVDPEKLKSTDTLEPEVSRRQRTQLSTASDLTLFDFDRDSMVLKNITGRVKSEYEHLFNRVTGSESLHISSKSAPGELTELCEETLNLYRSENYKTTFPRIQYVKPIRDPDVINRLNDKLLEAFRTENPSLNLAVPDIIDYESGALVSFSGCGKSVLRHDVSIEDYYSYLESGGKEFKDVEFDEFKKHHLALVGENEEPRGDRYSIFRCFVFDTPLSGSGSADIYHLNEGNWYKVEADYVRELKNFLSPLRKDLLLPKFRHAEEGEYNKAVAGGDGSYLCFDRKNISPGGQKAIEPCDLYAVQNRLDGDGRDGRKFGTFYHIKVFKESVRSATLSHLFNQGANSVRILRGEKSARNKLDALINNAASSDEGREEFKAPLRNGDYQVVFAIAVRGNKSGKPRNLPLFSQISLMRILKELERMKVPAVYGFIDCGE